MTSDAVDDSVVAASARAGFAARGVLYAIVGVLAAQLALGDAGEDASQQGAMEAVLVQPFGFGLLLALAVGLAGYALYRAVQAIRGRGDGSVLRRRVVPAIRAIVNGGLSVLAFQELAGVQSGTSESSVTAAVRDLPGGQLLVGLVGLVVVGVGGKQLWTAWSGEVNELAQPGELPPAARRTARIVGRLGHVGRGIAFAVVGGFLVRAAVTHDPDSGVGLDAALGEVLQTPFGTPLLLGIAACLFLFGAHCLVEAWFGRPRRSEAGGGAAGVNPRG